MGTINSLLEGANPYQALQNEAGKLAGKWGKSGLLEGIETSTEKNNMSILLENQAKQLVNEANSLGSAGAGTNITNGGNSEAWAGVALPLVRRVFGEIVAKDLVSVQPMNLPAGLIFYLDFRYGTNTGAFTAGQSLYAADTSDMKRTLLPAAGQTSGLYGASTFSYSITSASTAKIQVSGAFGGSNEIDQLGNLVVPTGGLAAASASGGHLTNFDTGSINFDNDFEDSLAGGVSDLMAIRVSTESFGTLGGDADFDSVRTWKLVKDSDKSALTMYSQFTTYSAANGYVEFIVDDGAITFGGGAAGSTNDANAINVVFNKTPDNLDDRGDFEDAMDETSGDISGLNIPEINVQLRSETVAAKTRKLKAQWTPEFAQDLNAYHSIDAEAELTSILSEYISMEIDLEILDMLIRNADTTAHWSTKIGEEVNDSGTVTRTHDTAGTYYTRMSWFQTLGIKLQKVSNLIHQKTLRGGANFIVVSPKISTILESIPGFAADSSGDQDKYAMGVQKIGAINSRYTVYKNPYMTENIILMGYKGSQFLETGAVFAPYIPLIMTPLVYDPASFTPRKGIMTRYAKKMVRPDFYGKVFMHHLNEI